jgi:hypothetical protein
MWRRDWDGTGFRPPTLAVPGWLPGLLSLTFTTGLQLSGVTQPSLGYALIAVSVVMAIAGEMLSRYPRRKDRWRLLESQLAKVSEVRTWLASHDEPDRSIPLDEDRVFQWAKRTYELISVGFPLYPDVFMGGDHVPFGPSFFANAYMDYLHALGRRDYLEDRAEIVRSILSNRGGTPSFLDKSASVP